MLVHITQTARGTITPDPVITVLRALEATSPTDVRATLDYRPGLHGLNTLSTTRLVIGYQLGAGLILPKALLHVNPKQIWVQPNGPCIIKGELSRRDSYAYRWHRTLFTHPALEKMAHE